jgi:hypothetical protein
MSSQTSEEKSLSQQEERQKGPQGPKGPRKYTDEYLEEEAKLIVKWAEETENLYLRDFAHERGYHPSRLSEFALSNKNFAQALERAKDIQEKKITTMALKKGADMAWVKYFLPRLLQDRPYLKSSWDSQEQVTNIHSPNVTINKIVSKDDSEDV